jgi:hypothetical protein
MGALSFRIAQDPRGVGHVRELLGAHMKYERVRAVRRCSVTLLAVAGASGPFLATKVAQEPSFRIAGVVAWLSLLAVVATTGALELYWRRRRDAAAALPQ